MPELAEVETFRQQLEPLLLNRRIEEIQLFHPRSTRRHFDKKLFVREVTGKNIESVSRFGKYLTFKLSSGKFLNVHLRMSGRFLSFDRESFDISICPKHTHVVILTKENAIAFIDPRTFGEFWLSESATPEILKGIDAYETSEDQIKENLLKFSQSKRPIKSLLLDQNVLSGIGNIYADEICATSKVLPTKKMSEMNQSEFVKISKSCRIVLKDAIESRGSSLRDESFRDLNGEIGKFQIHHLVHARKTCSRCGFKISKTKVAGRSTYFCANCQH